MKRIHLIISLLLGTITVSAQYPDNPWVLGSGSSQIDSTVGGIKMYFEGHQLVFESFDFAGDFWLTASSYTENGKVILYSDGCHIFNQFNNSLGAININGYHFASCGSGGYDLHNALLILKKPLSQLFYIFHLTKDYSDNPNDYSEITQLSLSVADLNANNNEGKLLFTDSAVVNGPLDYGYLTAVRHANGRDWWIIQPRPRSNVFVTILFGPDGIESIHEQIAGPKFEYISFLGESLFSEDGSIYVRGSNIAKNHLYHFNRCTGDLEYWKMCDFEIDRDSMYTHGLALSPNKRFLYFCSDYTVWQYDLYAADPDTSRKVVARFDGYREPLPTFFSFMELGPDGKIYITIPNGTKFLHVIENPNAFGKKCNVVQRGVNLPKQNVFQIPYYPNYALGALKGSPCDTLGDDLTGKISASTFRLYPNPTRGTIHIESKSEYHEAHLLKLYDARGRFLEDVHLNYVTGKTTHDLGRLPAGIYLYRIVDSRGDAVQEGKVVVNF